jgi:hypothetical protein
MKAAAVVLSVLAIGLLNTAPLGADSLDKAYFAATPPGAWAEYESNWEMPNGMAGASAYVYIRAEDSEDRVQVEIDTQTLSGPGEGMTTLQLFVMDAEFDLSRDFLNRMRHLEASVAKSGDGPAALMQDNVIGIMREASGDLTNSVTFQGTKQIEGRECDHYLYSYSTAGAYVTHQEGEICLDETVPFGVVYQKGRSTDTDGKLISSYEQRLVDSGTGKTASAELLAVPLVAAAPEPETPAPDAAPPMPLMEAFEAGKIRLFVEVVEGTGGRSLEITARNQSDEPLDVVVPEGPATIEVGFPIGDLDLVVDEEHRFALAPGDSAPPFTAGQPGDRGAVGGSFQLTVHEGSTSYQGSIDVGPLE